MRASGVNFSGPLACPTLNELTRGHRGPVVRQRAGRVAWNLHREQLFAGVSLGSVAEVAGTEDVGRLRVFTLSCPCSLSADPGFTAVLMVAVLALLALLFL